MAETQPRIFISYARADDEAFVERLHRDLEAAGIAVWWDRDTMASRGRTFLQEIRDAIEVVDRVIAVIGPGAIHSDYVRYEWEHALLFAKGLLPILRLGDYNLVPAELLPEDDQGLAASDLGRLHCLDFRAERPYEKTLNELVAIIRQPVPPLASYDGTPALPPHFLPRRHHLRRLKETVLADVLRPMVITSAKQTAALQGMGGIGKSVLAAAFARAISTRRAMGDGILWLSAGQDATTLTLLDNMKAAGTAFGGAKEDYVDEVSARQKLPKVLENKACLIVLDGVWSMEQVEPFRNALGPRCRLLVTTRDGSLVTALGAEEHRVDVFSDEQALALLAEWSGQVWETLPEEAGQVADECGNLPLALALCGAMARDGVPWLDLLDALRESDLTFIEARLPNYAFPNVLRALRVSVDMLDREDPAAIERYHDLAVFPRKAAVSEAAVVTLWCRNGGFSERNARKLLTTLGLKALMTVQGKNPDQSISLHDLQYDYLRAVAGEKIATLHGALIDAYRSKCPRGWASGPDDGYFFQFLPTHLAAAGRLDELRALLFDYGWIAAKLKTMKNVQSVLSDYDLVSDDTLTLVQRSLRLSAVALDQASKHLPAQLMGRLPRRERPAIDALASRAAQGQGGPWPLPQARSADYAPGISRLLTAAREQAERPALLPLRPTLTAPGAELRRLEGHHDGITAVAVLPDGRRAVSGSYDGTMRLWDLERGVELHSFKSEGSITAVALLPDGRRALSVSNQSQTLPDGSIISLSVEDPLRLWDLDRWIELRRFGGNEGEITALAVLPDGRQAVFSTANGILSLWDLNRGSEILRLKVQSERINALAVLPGDGRRVVTASVGSVLQLWDLDSRTLIRSFFYGIQYWMTCVAVLPDGRRAVCNSHVNAVSVWDLNSGARIHYLQGHKNLVSSIALLPGGRRAISGSYDGTLRLWDLDRGTELRSFEGHLDCVTAVASLPDGARAISGSSSGSLRFWDLDSDTKIHRYASHKAQVNSVAVLADGQRAISASPDGTSKLWDLCTGAEIRCIKLGQKVSAVAVLPDGARAVFGFKGGGLGLWDIDRGVQIRALKGHEKSSLDLWYASASSGLYAGVDRVPSVAVLPDGRRAISCSFDQTLRVWDLDSGAEIRCFHGYGGGQGTAMAVLPNGRHVLACSNGNYLQLLDLDGTAEIRCSAHYQDLVTAVAVLPDGRRAISGEKGGIARLWNLDTGAEIQRFERHQGWITSVTVLPDGQWAVSASSDCTLRLWNLESGAEHAVFHNDAAISCCAVTSDGRWVVAGDAFGRLHVLELLFDESPTSDA